MAPTPPPKPTTLPAEAKIRRTLVAAVGCLLPVAETEGLDYRLVGTASSLQRGVQLPVGDVDILVRDRRAVDVFGTALAAAPAVRCLFAPAHLPQARQYYANYDLGGVEVGISTVEAETDSDALECVGRGPWEHFDLVACGPYRVPAVATELRLISELVRNRPERYRPIVTHLRAHGCDLELVRRGLTARRIPAALQQVVLRELAVPA
jgi:hypothetical protein